MKLTKMAKKNLKNANLHNKMAQNAHFWSPCSSIIFNNKKVAFTFFHSTNLNIVST